MNDYDVIVSRASALMLGVRGAAGRRRLRRRPLEG